MLRYALIATHYRAPLEWGDATHGPRHVQRSSACPTAVAALESYDRGARRRPDARRRDRGCARRLRDAMDDDLNVSGGLGAVFELVRDLNTRVDERSLSTADAREGAAAIRDFDRVLAVLEVAAGCSRTARRRCSIERARRPGAARLCRVGPAARRAGGNGRACRGHARRSALASNREDQRWLMDGGRNATTAGGDCRPVKPAVSPTEAVSHTAVASRG